MTRLCILGGSPHHPGGLEAFCDRALDAMQQHGAGWETVLLPSDTAYLTPRRLPAFYRAMRALVLRHHETDLVWLQFSNLPDLLYLILARALRLPVLVTPHLGANSRLQRSTILRTLSRWVLSRADRLALLFDGQDAEIALPPTVPRSTLRTFLPERNLNVVPDTDHPGTTLRLIHAGRLSMEKGSFLLVDICAALKRAGVPFSARLIGRADKRTLAQLKQHITGQHVVNEIILSDWLAEADLHQALSAADVLVHLSTLDSYPLIVLEAMAANTMPLVLDMAGVCTMVARYDGMVVPQEAATGLAAKWLIDQDPGQLRMRGAAMGAQLRADFDWKACIAELLPILDATLRPRV